MDTRSGRRCGGLDNALGAAAGSAGCNAGTGRRVPGGCQLCRGADDRHRRGRQLRRRTDNRRLHRAGGRRAADDHRVRDDRSADRAPVYSDLRRRPGRAGRPYGAPVAGGAAVRPAPRRPAYRRAPHQGGAARSTPVRPREPVRRRHRGGSVHQRARGGPGVDDAPVAAAGCNRAVRGTEAPVAERRAPGHAPGGAVRDGHAL